MSTATDFMTTLNSGWNCGPKRNRTSIVDYPLAGKWTGVIGVTRARVTQVMDLLLLAPRVQDVILAEEVSISARDARGLVRQHVGMTQLDRLAL